MTIYAIRAAHIAKCPTSHFFDAEALRFFGQSMESFTVTPLTDGRLRIEAPIHSRTRAFIGHTVRIFDPISGTLMQS
jgi:hypothetical protein